MGGGRLALFSRWRNCRHCCAFLESDMVLVVQVRSSVMCNFCVFPVFFLSVVPPWIPLLHPEYLLLLLEQGEKSLEGHTRLLLVLTSLTTYLDDALCAFYDASLNIACRAPSSEDGPRANFAAFVEWTLAWKRLSVPRLFTGESHQFHFRPSAQLNMSPLHGAHA